MFIKEEVEHEVTIKNRCIFVQPVGCESLWGRVCLQSSKVSKYQEEAVIVQLERSCFGIAGNG